MIPMNRQSGEYMRKSQYANAESLAVLKKPICRKLPIALARNVAAMA
jgi:hypothetical protein